MRLVYIGFTINTKVGLNEVGLYRFHCIRYNTVIDRYIYYTNTSYQWNIETRSHKTGGGLIQV